MTNILIWWCCNLVLLTSNYWGLFLVLKLLLGTFLVQKTIYGNFEQSCYSLYFSFLCVRKRTVVHLHLKSRLKLNVRTFQIYIVQGGSEYRTIPYLNGQFSASPVESDYRTIYFLTLVNWTTVVFKRSLDHSITGTEYTYTEKTRWRPTGSKPFINCLGNQMVGLFEPIIQLPDHSNSRTEKVPFFNVPVIRCLVVCIWIFTVPD